MKKKVLISIMIILMILAPISVFAEGSSNNKSSITFKYNQENQKVLENTPTIGCKAAYVAEPTTGKVIYEKNAHEVFYPASTTKILTALVVLENCELTDTAIVSRNALSLVPAGYSNAKLQVDEELTIKDLLYALLIPSANEAANVLAEHVSGSVEAFAELCNNRAAELGCENLHFVNPSGIHNENHYCTAYDLYLIAKECQKYDIFNEIVKTTSFTLPATNAYSKNDRTFTNTNELIQPTEQKYFYPYCTGIKTGFTTPAGQCLVASSNYNNINLISVVLGGGTNNQGLNERFYDTKQLFEFAYNNYSIKEIVQEGFVVAKINVDNATKDTKALDVIVDNSIATIVPNDLDLNNLPTSIAIDENITAPIKQGQVLGQITFYADGLAYTTNIKAIHSVEKLPFGLYNTIITVSIILTIIIFVVLLKIFKKKRIKVLIIEVLVLIVAVVTIFTVLKKKDNKTITDALNLTHKNKTSTLEEVILDDEEKVKDSIYQALINIASRYDTTEEIYYARYFELGREKNENNVNIYVWAVYGRTDENKTELSASSIPIKLTLSLDDYSIIETDELPDATDAKKYFPAVADKIDDIGFKDIDSLCGETYYSK